MAVEAGADHHLQGPLARFSPLIQLKRRDLSALAAWRSGIAGRIMRRHLPLARITRRLALVQTEPLVSAARPQFAEASWPPAPMVWFGQTLTEAGPAVSGAPAVRRRVPAPIARRPAAVSLTAAAPRKAATRPPPSGVRSAHTSDRTRGIQLQPETASAPVRPAGWIDTDTDRWKRMFPQRPSFLDDLRVRESTIQREAVQRLPPPTIPARLPRTRTWEVKAGIPVTPQPLRDEPPDEEASGPEADTGDQEFTERPGTARAEPAAAALDTLDRPLSGEDRIQPVRRGGRPQHGTRPTRVTQPPASTPTRAGVESAPTTIQAARETRSEPPPREEAVPAGPDRPARIRPDTSAEIEAQPATGTEEAPAAQTGREPAARREPRPAARAEREPATRVEGEPAVRVEGRPVAHVEGRPVAHVERKPIDRIEGEAVARIEAVAAPEHREPQEMPIPSTSRPPEGPSARAAMPLARVPAGLPSPGPKPTGRRTRVPLPLAATPARLDRREEPAAAPSAPERALDGIREEPGPSRPPTPPQTAISDEIGESEAGSIARAGAEGRRKLPSEPPADRATLPTRTGVAAQVPPRVSRAVSPPETPFSPRPPSIPTLQELESIHPSSPAPSAIPGVAAIRQDATYHPVDAQPEPVHPPSPAPSAIPRVAAIRQDAPYHPVDAQLDSQRSALPAEPAPDRAAGPEAPQLQVAPTGTGEEEAASGRYAAVPQPRVQISRQAEPSPAEPAERVEPPPRAAAESPPKAGPSPGRPTSAAGVGQPETKRSPAAAKVQAHAAADARARKAPRPQKPAGARAAAPVARQAAEPPVSKPVPEPPACGPLAERLSKSAVPQQEAAAQPGPPRRTRSPDAPAARIETQRPEPAPTGGIEPAGAGPVVAELPATTPPGTPSAPSGRRGARRTAEPLAAAPPVQAAIPATIDRVPPEPAVAEHPEPVPLVMAATLEPPVPTADQLARVPRSVRVPPPDRPAAPHASIPALPMAREPVIARVETSTRGVTAGERSTQRITVAPAAPAGERQGEPAAAAPDRVGLMVGERSLPRRMQLPPATGAAPTRGELGVRLKPAADAVARIAMPLLTPRHLSSPWAAPDRQPAAVSKTVFAGSQPARAESPPASAAPWADRFSAQPAARSIHAPAAVQRLPAEESPPAEAGASDSGPGPDSAPEGAQPDVDQLARDVYEILKLRLLAEREQYWGC